MNLDVEEFKLLRDIIVEFQELFDIDRTLFPKTPIEILDKSISFDNRSKNTTHLRVNDDGGISLFAMGEHNGIYKPLNRVEIDDPHTYFDSSLRDEQSIAAITYGDYYNFPLLDCKSEDYESTMFQMSTVYSFRDQFILGMDYFLKNHLKRNIYACISVNYLKNYSTEFYQEVLKELRKL